MRKLTFIVVCMLCSSAAFAQKGKVMSATSFFTQGKLDKAKELIDEAITHEKCVGWAKAYVVRGQIYQAIYESKDEAVKKLAPAGLPVVWESYQKAIELDTKGKLVKDMQTQAPNLVIDFTNEAVTCYNDGRYQEALDYFEDVLDIHASVIGTQKVDTMVIFNAGIAAQKAGKMDKALKYYKRSLELDYNPGQTYAMLANILLTDSRAANEAGDSVKGTALQEEAVAYLLEGNKRFPEDEYMLIELINYYLMGDEPAKSEQYLDAIIRMHPDNASYYRTKGTLYEKLKNMPAAEEMYRKTLELDPTDFVAQYNLGNIQLTKVIEAHKDVNDISDMDEYNKAFDEIMNQYEAVVPYFERARELKPEDMNTLTTLKELYFRLRTRNPEYQQKYDEVTAKIERL